MWVGCWTGVSTRRGERDSEPPRDRLTADRAHRLGTKSHVRQQPSWAGRSATVSAKALLSLTDRSRRLHLTASSARRKYVNHAGTTMRHISSRCESRAELKTSQPVRSDPMPETVNSVTIFV